MQIISNTQALAARETPPQADELFPASAIAQARAEISSWPGYEPTPLHHLSGLARHLGLQQIFYKDEGTRFGLKSFKALGGAYAVMRLLKTKVEKETGQTQITSQDLMKGLYSDITRTITVTTATDGNHGRSVAWGAKTFGCNCMIFIPEAVSGFRQEAMEALGARVERVAGSYNDAVHHTAAQARENGRLLIADTAVEGDPEAVRRVMEGYTVMTGEAMEQIGSEALPTHTLVQVGVGALAAAVLAHLWQAWGPKRPWFISVEPVKAACLFESIAQGSLVTVSGDLETLMGGLACGEVSPLIWELLQAGVDNALCLEDEPAVEAMRLLARGTGEDPPVVAGESAVAGLAALLKAKEDQAAWQALGLGPDSRVLLFGTEGDTDPRMYQKLVGKSAPEVLEGKS